MKSYSLHSFVSGFFHSVIFFFNWLLPFYVNTMDFYVFTSCPEPGVNSLISSSSFFVDALRFSMCIFTASAKKDSFTYSFPIWMLFTSFSWVEVSESWHPWLALDLGWNIQSFTIKYDVSCRFLPLFLICWEVFCFCFCFFNLVGEPKIQNQGGLTLQGVLPSLCCCRFIFGHELTNMFPRESPNSRPSAPGFPPWAAT